VNLEDVFASRLIGRADVDQLVEPSGPQQGCSSSIPSISARIVLTTRAVTCGSPPMPLPRAGTRLSISSMNTTQGATWRARANSLAICCSLSPYHLDNRSDDLIAMKLASASFATALASRVLPVPGGP
jgi:hypothetical protein